jgi:hypothetical protein
VTVVTWLGCDLVSGRIIEELPELTPSGGSLSGLLAAYTSTSLRLPIALGGHGAPPRDWLGATEPGRTMIVAVLQGQPVWAGIVLVRRGGTDANVELAAVTVEGYLDRRYVGDHPWDQQDEASVIAAGLIADAQTEGINFVVDAPPTGTLRDRRYYDEDDATVYSRLRELMGVRDGPEWAVRLSWADASQTAVAKTIMVRKRIGYVSETPTAVYSTGTASAVVDAAGAAEARYVYTEDYGAGYGANHVVATSSGEGEQRPQSDPARAEQLLAAGWPRWEHRSSPGSSISNPEILNAHAQRIRDLMGAGAHTLTIVARADAYPLLGRDWWPGDDIGYDLVGHRHPDGVTGVARAIGYDLDPVAGTISPILLAPGADLAAGDEVIE